MGTLGVTGTPTPAWQQSAAPLADEGAVVALYFAALRSAEEDQPAWWASVAPSVPFASAQQLVGATVTYNDTTFDPVLAVTGTTFTGATLVTKPVLAGGAVVAAVAKSAVTSRLADDSGAGFEHHVDAQQFLSDLRERLAKFSLELHPDKSTHRVRAQCCPGTSGPWRRETRDLRLLRLRAMATVQVPAEIQA